MSDKVKAALIQASAIGLAALVLAIGQSLVQQEMREGTLCTLYQLGVHRVNAAASDRAIGDALDVPDQQAAPAPTNVEIDPQVCDDYFTEDGALRR